MSGFNNPVVGALKLIRRAIQSPNYQAGADGWTINEDGTAEFNDLTIRGKIIVESSDQGIFVYRGTPGAGNLAVAIASATGTDPYGNDYQVGINVFTLDLVSNATLTLNDGQLGFFDPGRFVNGFVEQLPAANASDFPAMLLSGPCDSQDPVEMTTAEIQLQGTSADDTAPARVLLHGVNAITGAPGSIPVEIDGTLYVTDNAGVTKAMASQPGFGTTGSFVEFTGAQWPALTITCPPSETIEIVSRMQGYNNASTGSTLAIAPKVKIGSTTLAPADARQGCYVTIQSTTLTNNLHAIGSCVIGQDVLGGQAGKTLTIVPCWRITSGSAATANLANGSVTVAPLLYSVPTSSF